jgi:hypothetical protein
VRARVVVGALGLALLLVLVPVTLAPAEFRGTDLWSNVAPGGVGGLVDRYPLSHYALDYHVDEPSVGFSGISSGDVPSLIAQFSASLVFLVLTWFMRVVIGAFDWAFSVDVVGGPHGVLTSVAGSAQHLYGYVVVPLLASAFALLGAWLVAKLLERRFGDIAGGVVRAVCLFVVAVVIIAHSNDTVGRAISIGNDLSSAVVSGTTGGNGARSVSDQLFTVFVYQPWVVLEFGGFKRCTGERTDKDGFPLSVAPDAPGAKTCHDVLHQGSDGHGGYAPRFLRYASGSKERDDEYRVLDRGEKTTDPQFAGYSVDRTDAPAVDLMQAGGAVQRVAFLSMLVVGIVGAVLLIGLLCFAALFAQLAAMLLLAATPIMVLVAIVPSAHGIFWGWARLLAKMLIVKVVYSVLLAAVVGVSAGVMAAAPVVSYAAAFAFQAALFVGVFACRKQLASRVTGASKRDYRKAEGGAKSFVVGAGTAAVGAVAAPTAAAGAMASKSRDHMWRQKPAVKPADKGSGDQGKTRPDSSSPPASAGREYSPSPPLPADVPSVATATMPASTGRNGSASGEEERRMPIRSFKEDLELAREQQKRGETPGTRPLERLVPASRPPNGRVATRENLAQELEERRERQRSAVPPEQT